MDEYIGKAHKNIKDLKTQNLRDHMSEAELIFTAFYTSNAESVEARGMLENKKAGKKGGEIAKKARLELEKKTGKKIISTQNYLPPAKSK